MLPPPYPFLFYVLAIVAWCIQASFQKVHVGDEMLDAILSMMSKKAHEKGVQIEIEGEIQNQNNHDIYELCAILSNAISNAVGRLVTVQP